MSSINKFIKNIEKLEKEIKTFLHKKLYLFYEDFTKKIKSEFGVKDQNDEQIFKAYTNYVEEKKYLNEIVLYDKALKDLYINIFKVCSENFVEYFLFTLPYEKNTKVDLEPEPVPVPELEFETETENESETESEEESEDGSDEDSHEESHEESHEQELELNIANDKYESISKKGKRNVKSKEEVKILQKKRKRDEN